MEKVGKGIEKGGEREREVVSEARLEYYGTGERTDRKANYVCAKLAHHPLPHYSP